MRINQSVIETMAPEHQMYIHKLLEYIEGSTVDVKALVVYGSSINHTRYHSSDVDCYIYTDDPKGHTLGKTAIIDHVGYDVFVVNTEFLMKIVHLELDLLPLITDGVPLYVSNEQIITLLDQYKHQAMDILTGSEQLNRAMLRHKQESDLARMYLINSTEIQETLLYFQSWLYHHTCMKAYQRGTYLMHGSKSIIPLLQTIYHPNIYLEIIEVIQSEKTLEAILSFIQSYDPEYIIQKFEQKKAEEFHQMSLNDIKEYFQELVSFFRKVEHAYQVDDLVLLFNYVCSLQKELDVLLPSMNMKKVKLLVFFQHDSNELILESARLEADMRKRLDEMGIILDEVNHVNEWNIQGDVL